MALKKRKADEATTKEFFLHSGLFAFKVIAYNPSLEQLKKLGFNFNQESEYVITNDFGTSYKATFWLENCEEVKVDYKGKEHVIKPGDIRLPLTYFIQEDLGEAQSGKKLFVNKYGQTNYRDSVEELPDWFNVEVRQGHKGEDNLYTFLAAYANLKTGKDDKDENCMTEEEIQQLFKDDSFFKEYIQDLINTDHIVRALVEIKSTGEGDDGKLKVREQVYPQYFNKFNVLSTGWLENYINKDDYNKPKGEIYTFEPTIYTIDDARKLIVDSQELDADDDNTYSGTSEEF